MILALALGCGWGIGLWALAVYVVPPRVSLGEALARTTPTPQQPAPRVETAGGGGWVGRVGHPFVGPLHALGLPGAQLVRDLAVLGRPASEHLAQKAVLGLAGLLLPALAQLVLALAGAAPGIELPALAALVLAVAGFLLPDLGVRRDAAALRTGLEPPRVAPLHTAGVHVPDSSAADRLLPATLVVVLVTDSQSGVEHLDELAGVGQPEPIRLADGGQVRRDRATELLIEMLRRLDAGGGWQLDVVQELYLFGSYARGALNPGDVDIAVDFDHEHPEWKQHFLTSFSYGGDPHATLRTALRGRVRSLSLTFERDGHGDIPMMLLWRRGDALPDAIDRVMSIGVDASAGRAERDALPDYLHNLGDKLPRYLRQELVALVDDGVIVVQEVDLPEGRPSATWIDEFVDHRWAASSPLRRAALAVLAHWEQQGVDLSGVHLHGTDLDYYSASTPYFTGFQLRYFRAARRCFTDHDGEEWMEVVAPPRRGPVQALLVRRGPEFSTSGWSWSHVSYFS